MLREIKRLVIVALVIAIPAVFVFLGVRGFVVRNAVITGHLDVVQSPLEGLVTAVNIAAGSGVNGGGEAVSVRDPRSDPSEIASLSAEIEERLRELESRHRSLTWHDEALAEQQKQLQATMSALTLDLQMEHEIALADVAASEARIAYLSAQLERVRRLQGSTASEASLDAAEADLKEAQARLDGQRLQVERIEQRLTFLGRSVLILETVDDAVAIASSIRSLSAGRHTVTQEISDLESELDSLSDKLMAEQETFERISTADITVPGEVVIWEIFVDVGVSVNEGEALFSYAHCEQRLTQATVDDTTVALIRSEHPVVVYVYGEDEPISGKVHSIYGSAGHFERSQSLAASVKEVGTTDAIVLIEIEPASEASRRHRLCDIGRTAYVEFEGIGFLDPFLNRLF